MVDPQVSVLLSCYNAERWLRRSLESLQNQTFQDFEIVLINDGSRDGTLSIVEEFAKVDKRVRSICKEHTGLTPSLNFGLFHARANWIARLDADDECDARRLAYQLDYVKKNTAVGLVGTGALEIDERGRVLRSHTYPADHEKLVARLLSGRSIFAHSSAFFSRKIALDIGGYRAFMVRSQDRDLWLRISERAPIAAISEPLVKVRRHDEQLSESDKGRQQVVYRYACMISYFSRLWGMVDPLEHGDQGELLYMWLEDKLEESGVFRTHKSWKAVRDQVVVRRKLPSLHHLMSLSGSDFMKHILFRQYGTDLPRKLAQDWCSTRGLLRI